ncbi:MAG: 3-isopropylmalate dehydrogenase [Muribaculaceae bacterium]|nr:3-isopropylmalate dehydrogenase [Muribaculaceae bacterium]
MKLKIAVLPGDGIGPEISRVGVDVMKAVADKFGHEFEFDYGLAGAAAIRATGNPFPDETYELCKESDAVLFSAVGDPEFDNNPAAKVRPEQGLLAMRKKLGLFANIRPIMTFPGLLDKSPLRADIVKDADFVCVRELTGGMYFGEKFESDDKAYDTNLYTRGEVERILKVAFELAMRRNKHVTVVDKANVLASSRLWRKVAQGMEKDWPEVTTDYMYVDNAAMRMIQDPRFFDVMVTENTFGDILTDEASVISGSMGLLPSSSIGESTPVFEPIHGSWPQATGLDIANPLAQVLSVAMLLEHFGLEKEGTAVREAVMASLKAGVVTPDLGEGGKSEYGTQAVGKWLCEFISSSEA